MGLRRRSCAFDSAQAPQTSTTPPVAEPKPMYENFMNGYMYILQCADGSYYTGSTSDLDKRLLQHQMGEGAIHTKSRLPVKLVYYESFARIDEAFYREKQIQGWSRKKKESLISGDTAGIRKLAECKNETHFRNKK